MPKRRRQTPIYNVCDDPSEGRNYVFSGMSSPGDAAMASAIRRPGVGDRLKRVSFRNWRVMTLALTTSALEGEADISDLHSYVR